MTLREDERSIIIQYRIKQAEQALDDAEFLLINKRLSLAANRIYYSLFYSISAVALKNNFSTAKHKQLIGWFNRHFINTGIVDKKYSKLVYSAFENREKGDYDFLFTLSHEELE
ncbi:MAG: HEPN domain-containing protein, partial [Phaeovulum sp.]|uniref:HEPN domain-containing protein n=1 Tax=Phaeovulum sp. TaxID=2934796 RepID=UPI0027348C81